MIPAAPGSASPLGGADPRWVRRGSLSAVDPRSDEVRIELGRVADRWSVLPVSKAEAGLSSLREVLDRLTAAGGQDPVPDLGPGTALHQLKVLVWESARQGRADGIPELLAELRRALP